MAEIWSPDELAEMEAICRRVSPLLRPEAHRILDKARARFSGKRSEHEARGARFELRMLGRLADDELRELELERPVAPGATDCTVDLFLPSRGTGIEFMAAQHLIIPPVQVSADCSEQYLQEECALGNPLSFIDSFGLSAQVCWRGVQNANWTGAKYCYVQFNRNSGDTLSYWADWITDDTPHLTPDLDPNSRIVVGVSVTTFPLATSDTTTTTACVTPCSSAPGSFTTLRRSTVAIV